MATNPQPTSTMREFIELTARMLSATADEAARLLLTDPQAYPVPRLVAHARWVLSQLGP